VKDTDIVIQGGIWPETVDIAMQYSKLDFVKNVFISTWESEKEKLKGYETKINFVFSKMPKEDGGGNINLQIISSFNGVNVCRSENVVKMRSDQTIPQEEMYRMNDFYRKNLTGNEVFVLGLMGLELPSHPYHPQDHVFWGKRKNVLNLFDIPLSSWESYKTNTDFSTNIRSPMYIGVYAYSKISKKALNHLNNPQKYLLDKAPKRDEAFQEYAKIKDLCFKSFPRINMIWHKYNNQNYPYDFYHAQGERYYD
jgi:hypothetical protein